MQANLSSQKNSIIVVVIILLLCGAGYYFYSKQLSGTESSSSVNPDLFSSKVKAYYLVQEKVNIKESDLAFTKKVFYTDLIDHTVEIATRTPDRRDAPFWPK